MSAATNRPSPKESLAKAQALVAVLHEAFANASEVMPYGAQYDHVAKLLRMVDSELLDVSEAIGGVVMA